MKRNTFLKLSTTLMAAPFISPLEAGIRQKKLTNWAGNLEYSTNNVFYPNSVEEVQKLVKKFNKVTTLGTRHCFNSIADSKYNLICTAEMNNVVGLDANARTVTVEGGIKYGELAPWLDQKGFALHNLASLPHISVAGSCTTATHGSGVKNANLASGVSALEIVTANGSVLQLSRKNDPERFKAAVVGLGAFGVITKVTLDILPTYKMRQKVFLNLPLAELKQHFEKIISSGYSVSLFTDWQNESINEVWIKSLEGDDAIKEDAPEFFGAKAASKNMHPIAALSPENCTEQMGIAGSWYQRLPHFKMGFTPSSGKELQAEYFIPLENAVDAILAVQKMGGQIGPHLFISEIRTIDEDDLWMSPCHRQKSATIHFTWKQDWPAVSKLLPLIEQELEPFKARPHWGKLFTMSSQTLQSRYEKLPDFKALVASYDPRGKFRNDFLNKTIFANV